MGHFDVGTTFGDWTVTGPAAPTSVRTTDLASHVRCACGVERDVPNGRLRSGRSQGCGCRRGRRFGEASERHGKSYTATYKLWTSIKHRLANDRSYEGIAMYAPWSEDFTAFEAFLETLGPKPTPEHTIDRIEPSGNYEPGNLRWADKSTQSKNRRAFKTGPKRAAGDAHGKTQTPLYRLWISIRDRLRREKAYASVRMHEEWDRHFEAFEEHVLGLGPKPTPQHTLDRIDPSGDYAPGNVRWADKKTQSENRRNAKSRNVEANSVVEVGQRFERLTVTGLCLRESGGQTWYAAAVRCDCGTEKVVTQKCLLSGRTRSCGCLKNENLAPWAKPGARPNAHPLARTVTVNGETLNLSAWARRLGVPLQTITQRLKSGWAPERAVTEPPRKARSVDCPGGQATESVRTLDAPARASC